MFGIEGLPVHRRFSVPFLKGTDGLRLSSARSGIRLLGERLSPAQIWMPSFLCRAMVDSVAGLKTQLLYYEVDGKLAVSDGDWLKKVGRGDVVIFIDYFGFPAPAQFVRAAKEKGAWIVEDACQALLSPQNPDADYVLYSPRKFVGVPDGGILVQKKGHALDHIQLKAGSENWIQTSLRAGELRAEFDCTGADKGWFKLFQQTESLCPVEPSAMSEITQELLPLFDYAEISRRRRENYRTLARQLADTALYPELPGDVVPLGFPVVLRNRDRIRMALFEKKIYSPVHWLIEGIVPPEFRASHKLASEIMTIPCDQRYGREDMSRIIKVLKSA